MPTSRRLHAWFCVLLVLLQAVAPALHALHHHRAPAGQSTRGGAACACGQVHTLPGPNRPEGAAAVSTGTLSEPEQCAVCEILRGIRVFDGPPSAPEAHSAPALTEARIAAPAAPRAAPRPQPFLARAPPQLLV